VNPMMPNSTMMIAITMVNTGRLIQVAERLTICSLY